MLRVKRGDGERGTNGAEDGDYRLRDELTRVSADLQIEDSDDNGPFSRRAEDEEELWAVEALRCRLGSWWKGTGSSSYHGISSFPHIPASHLMVQNRSP